MIYLYLNAVACGEKHNYRCVETLLLCAYNIEVCSENGLLKSVSFRMPVLAQASIYHEEKNLHASDLKVTKILIFLITFSLINFFIFYFRDGKKIVTKRYHGDQCNRFIKSLPKIV